MNKFLDDCTTILASHMNDFTGREVNENIREFTPPERFLAYLWMANEVNKLRVNNGWSTKLLIFPEEDESISLALLELGLTKPSISPKKYLKIIVRYDKELVELIELHEVVKGIAHFVTSEGSATNRYRELYIAIVDNIEELKDTYPREYIDIIESLGMITKPIVDTVVNDVPCNNDRSYRINVNMTEIVYKYILRKFPYQALSAIVNMGFIKELPFDIIYEAVRLLLMDLYIHDIDYTAILSSDETKLKPICTFVNRCAIVVNGDRKIQDRAIELVKKIVDHRRCELLSDV
nr:MAG TPA: hypothetical protein [Caudoviricetes sp.]